MARYFRIVGYDPPREEDFLSNRARGLAPRGIELRVPRLHDGISLWDSLAGARRRAQEFPLLGEWIAEIEIEDRGPCRVEPTLARGHFTGFGIPADFLARRVAVHVAR